MSNNLENILKSKELLDLIEKEIHAEHNLIANRMTWYVASQSFLMAAFTITGNKEYGYSWLAILIPGLGVLNSVIIWLSLQAAIQAMNNCKEFQRKLFEKDNYFKDSKELQKIFVESPDNNNSGDYKPKWINEVGLLPPRFIPLFFLTVWLFIFVKIIFTSPYLLQNDINDQFLLIKCILMIFLFVIIFIVFRKISK